MSQSTTIKVNILDVESFRTTFGDLPGGQCFLYAAQAYIKMHCRRGQAILLDNFQEQTFSENTPINRLCDELEINVK